MKTNFRGFNADPFTNEIKNLRGETGIANSVFEDTLLGRCISEYVTTFLKIYNLYKI